ncbi:MAG TPA: DUF4080 domain-containing protein, partial [Prosthecobacter sp.]|nr:DUF4080 domain-containing protein [Prosthecobacter sp.]
QAPLEIVEAILAREPRIVGFGVYIWNVGETTVVVGLLKRLRPELIVILGGPEVSYETGGQAIVGLADHVITGEADLKFAEVCGQILGGVEMLPKVMAAELPALGALASPYELYTDEDVAQRVVYVEASRGCPFTCEFCLSSLDIPVRAFPLERFLSEMQGLLDRGARQFKFVDRTFNLHLPTSSGILQFFLDRWREGMFLHFEMVPDRLPEQLRALIRKFPAGAVQFEVGIQTFDELTSKNISRRQNVDRLADNFRFLREETGVHIHADLIVGLPGEGLESFGRGFDRLVRLGPQEIQVGILKRLRGTPIVRHDQEYEMVYAPQPPYEILSTRDIAFKDMQRMRRFARYWDLVANSGNFTRTLAALWGEEGASPFEGFLRFSDWLYLRLGRTHQIALQVLAEMLFEFLVEEGDVDPEEAERVLRGDWERMGRREVLNPRRKAADVERGPLRASQRQVRHAQERVR